MGRPGKRLFALMLAVAFLCAFQSLLPMAAPCDAAGEARAPHQPVWLRAARDPKPNIALSSAETGLHSKPSVTGWQAAFILAATLFALLFALTGIAEECRFPTHLGAGVRLTCCHIQRAPPRHRFF